MDAQYALLKQFVQCMKSNPSALHDPKLEFFKEYLESMGATIPAKTEESSAPKCDMPKTEATPEPEPMEQEEEEPAIPHPELDNSGVVEADAGEELPMGDDNKEATDDDLEKANEARDQAMSAFSEGDYEKSVQYYSTAIGLNPGSAIMHAKRANALLKLKRPVAAIADCDKAIKINADSAQGYKFRGRANGLLGRWVEAHTDLAMACRLDYDDTANEWLKEVEPNAKKLQEYNRAVARQKEEKELNERRERVRKAQEANRKAAEEAAKAGPAEDDEFGGMPGGMGGMGGLFDDPEVAAALQDPEVEAAFAEIMQNPQNLVKHIGNPKVMKVIGKMKSAFGGMGGPGGFPFPGGMGGGCQDSHCEDSACGGPPPSAASSAPPPPPSAPTGRAPEPDLD